MPLHLRLHIGFFRCYRLARRILVIKVLKSFHFDPRALNNGLIKKSGLYHQCERVVVGCVGAQEDTKSLMKILGSSKYEAHYWGEEGFEQPTLRLLADKTKDGIVCYFHTKGASKLACT